MDPENARELLARERARIEGTLAGQGEGEGADEPSNGDGDPADIATEQFDTEIEEGIAEHLRDQLEAIERAEKRLDEGTYGLSIESGEPIPDGRLELIPWAERTAEEQERWERGG
jgi:DnaK suppressor protein